MVGFGRFRQEFWFCRYRSGYGQLCTAVVKGQRYCFFSGIVARKRRALPSG